MGFLTLFSTALLLTVIVESQSADCPELYKRYSKEHTFCKPENNQCTLLRQGVSEDDKKVILQEHNKYRSKCATGKEKNLPPATNMLQMVWDDELAAVAQKHASQCIYEHDCNNCRRVQNFGVGQNLAKEEMSFNPQDPTANWANSVKMWYDEVQFFPLNSLDTFISPPKENTWGHFSQVIWAESWRIGCGYSLFKNGNLYTKLYTCNYGPGGNMKGAPVYKKGPICSACPLNSDCDKSVGLCKINDDKGPTYKPQGSYLFYCDFQKNNDDCAISEMSGKWLTYSTLSGNYLSITAAPGEETRISFMKEMKPTQSSMCVVTYYRAGPNKDGDEESYQASETFTTNTGYKYEAKLRGFGASFRQQFSAFNMGLGWNMPTTVKLSFSVPAGKTKQFFEVSKIYGLDGECPK